MTGILATFRELHATSDPGMKAALSRYVRGRESAGVGKKIGKAIMTGGLVNDRKFQKVVLQSLLGGTGIERRRFAEGLLLGCTVFERCEAQAAKKQTDATAIYFVLWLYCSEIAAMRSVGEAGRALESLFKDKRNFLGDDWTSRFRKIANRIKLSYRTPVARLSSD